MSKYDVVGICIVVMVVTSIVGAYFDLNSTEVDFGYSKPSGITASFDLISDSIDFFWDVITYQAPVPVLVSSLILVPLYFMAFFVLAMTVRGIA